MTEREERLKDLLLNDVVQAKERMAALSAEREKLAEKIAWLEALIRQEMELLGRRFGIPKDAPQVSAAGIQAAAQPGRVQGTPPVVRDLRQLGGGRPAQAEKSEQGSGAQAKAA